eukprot:14850732-Alexandrium_andersonii.AAC.1
MATIVPPRAPPRHAPKMATVASRVSWAARMGLGLFGSKPPMPLLGTLLGAVSPKLMLMWWPSKSTTWSMLRRPPCGPAKVGGPPSGSL